MGVIHVTLFMGAVLGLCALPGPDMMYIVGRSMTHGRKAGAISALGIASAALIHTLVVACGLSVLLSAVPTAYAVIRIAGACYLIYLGIEAIVAAHRPRAASSDRDTNRAAALTWQHPVLNRVLDEGLQDQWPTPNVGAPVLVGPGPSSSTATRRLEVGWSEHEAQKHHPDRVIHWPGYR